MFDISNINLASFFLENGIYINIPASASINAYSCFLLQACNQNKQSV
jgi:hypothetical protein